MPIFLQNKHPYIVPLFMIMKKTRSMHTILVIIKGTITLLVKKELIGNFNDSKNYPLIRIKSDNCSQQYCCLHAFEVYLKFSTEIKKPIILYGHERGLVDVMSGFDVKSPLRQAIVTDDFFFNSDIELVDFLKKVHEGDFKHRKYFKQKYFKHLPSNDIEVTRKERGDGVKIDGCRKSRMIALFPDET